jgi:chondroitin 4-sulfotransferase 11
VLVSDSRKLVFIHIQKTGGSTVSRLLKENVPDIYSVGARHDFAIHGKKKVEGWDDYFKFAFVRNPWDRLVSWYSMVMMAQETGNRQRNTLWRYVRENSSSFEEFIYNCTDEVEVADGVYYSFAYNQLDYVTDKDGNLLIDFIGRLENFENDVREVSERAGIKLELESIPHKNRAFHRHYSTYYTPETEMIVKERFRKDIEYFGYRFERPPIYDDMGLTEDLTEERFFQLERQVQSLKGRLAEESRRRERHVRGLNSKLVEQRRRNRILANRLEEIETSRSWRLLNRLARVRARILSMRTTPGK